MKDTALVQFKLMLPASLKARVDQHATANRRSLSQEIVAALEEKFPEPIAAPLDMAAVTDYLNAIERAASEAERDDLIRLANESMSANPATAGLKIGLTLDPDGTPVPYVSRRRE